MGTTYAASVPNSSWLLLRAAAASVLSAGSILVGFGHQASLAWPAISDMRTAMCLGRDSPGMCSPVADTARVHLFSVCHLTQHQQGQDSYRPLCFVGLETLMLSQLSV